MLKQVPSSLSGLGENELADTIPIVIPHFTSFPHPSIHPNPSPFPLSDLSNPVNSPFSLNPLKSLLSLIPSNHFPMLSPRAPSNSRNHTDGTITPTHIQSQFCAAIEEIYMAMCNLHGGHPLPVRESCIDTWNTTMRMLCGEWAELPAQRRGTKGRHVAMTFAP